MERNDQKTFSDFLAQPVVGTTLAVSAGLSFFFLCMILPLVGPAGSKVAHAAQNRMAFTGVLQLTFLLAALAVCSKMIRRKEIGGSIPLWSMGLCVLCILTQVVLLMGGFSI